MSYKPYNSFATAAQGTKADNAVPNTRTVNGHALSSDVTVTKGDVGLGNADNTSDANKPVSTATAAAISALNLTSSTYTPSATNITNITSSTPNNASYSRNGNIVTVLGSITVTNTLAVASEVDISLPVASNLAAASDLNGQATMDATASVNMYIKGDATNDRASIFFTSAGIGQTSTIYYSFQYKVI